MEFFFFVSIGLSLSFFFLFSPFSLFQVCELTKLIGESARHNRASVSLVFFFFCVVLLFVSFSFFNPFPLSFDIEATSCNNSLRY